MLFLTRTQSVVENGQKDDFVHILTFDLIQPMKNVSIASIGHCPSNKVRITCPLDLDDESAAVSITAQHIESALTQTI
jgi:hypothetical protein